MNIAKIHRRIVLKNICERLFERFPTWANNITSNTGIEKLKKTLSRKENKKKNKKTILKIS